MEKNNSHSSNYSRSSFIEFFQISKTFGDQRVNNKISFSIEKNSIHGLIGENGAGKSTLMKIFFGLLLPDSGIIKINGQSLKIKSPMDAFKNRIGMVHQHFMLSSEHTAIENILLLNQTQNPFDVFNNQNIIEEIKSTARKYNFQIPWDLKVKNLPVGVQQKIEILKLLYQNHEILIFDEPTAVLTPNEIQEFLDQLRKLKENHKTIILISHKLREIKTVCDNVTIFRKGDCAGTFKTSHLSESDMAEKMVGRSINFTKREFKKFPNPKTVLKLENIHFNDSQFKKIQFDFKLQQGEILGIAGIEGNGQNQLINFLLDPKKYLRVFSPEVKNPVYEFGNRSFLNLSKTRIRQQSLGVLPEDRLRLGVLKELKAFENFILGYEASSVFQKNGFLHWQKIKSIAEEQLKSFHVEPADINKEFQDFSGGNQQKLVVAREFYLDPQVIIASHPTRGVDIGSIEIIHEKIIAAQEKGVAFLLISSELDELIKLSDRILIIRDARFVKEFSRSEFDEKSIGKFMLGVSS